MTRPTATLTASPPQPEAPARRHGPIEANARRAWPVEPDAGLESLLASAELLATAEGLTGESFPQATADAAHTGAQHAVPENAAPGGAAPAQPEVEALLHASRGVAEFGNPAGANLDLAQTEFDQALELARARDLGYLEVRP